MSEDPTPSRVEQLFKQASENGKAQFLFTLLRVDGMTRGRRDPLLVAEEIVAELGPEPRLALAPRALGVTSLRTLRRLLEVREVYELLLNLARCVKGEAYLVSPFGHLGTGRFPNYQPPALAAILDALERQATEAAEPVITEFTSLLRANQFAALLAADDFAVRGDVVVGLPANVTLDLETLGESASRLLRLYGDLFAAGRRFRLEFKALRRFHKWPHFMTVELLTAEDVGLYGFKVHNDGGSASIFARGPDSTDAINLGFTENQLAFDAGILDKARREWMVGDKRLCEVGLAGRYNDVGYWKPLIHPGATDAIQQDVLQAAEDWRVRGALFYMYCTGYRGIEFAAKATLELPGDLRFPSGIELYKSHSDAQEGVWIYDGWLELRDTKPETIIAALRDLERAMRRLALAYDVDLRWCLKYPMRAGGAGWAQPSEEDLRHLEALSAVPSDVDVQRILDGAIDWYQSGHGASDAATRYLCYWIALESLAVALAEGELRAHYGDVVPEADRQAAEDEARRDIQALYDELYAQGPIDFVIRAYFDAIPGSITKKTRTALKAVFRSELGCSRALVSPARWLFPRGHQAPVSAWTVLNVEC